MNRKLEPLAYVSIQVKELQSGTVTTANGTYELELEEGKYDLVVSMIGYKTQTISLVVDKDYLQNIILADEETKPLSEVVVKGKAKDRAEEIVRNVIRSKEKILEASGAYSCNMYIKAVQQDIQSGNSAAKKASGDTSAQTKDELARMSMAEVSLHFDHETDQRIKEERTGVKRSGKPDGLFYLSATQGSFNFYNNLVKVPALSETPFLSPLSYSGLLAYKFKTLKVEQQGNRKIYTISVKPRQLSNATVEGEMIIMDSAWVVLYNRYRFPKYHLPRYDFFEVEQHYSLVNNKAWMLRDQQFTYRSDAGKHNLSGHTTVFYSAYELNKNFPSHYFGAEVTATMAEAYQKDSTFWGTVRTEPLTTKEVRYIQYKDSVFRATHTKQYLDSIDRITNRITFKKVALTGQTLYSREKERTWQLPPAVSLYQPVAFGGSRINLTLFYFKTFPSRKNISVFSNVSYGIRNHDVNGSIRLNRMYNPFNRGFYSVTLGRDFQFIFAGDAWINMLKRSNQYLSNSFGIGHGIELTNGLFLYNDLDIALRRSLSEYKTGHLIDRVDSSLGNVLDNNQPVAFEPYNALYGKIRLQYTPKQRYIREPKEKVILGSAWPTFYTTWRKGIPDVLNSKVNFDYLEFGIEQQITLGILGTSRYNIKTGSFLNRKGLELVDYQFQRRGDPLLFMNPDQSFQVLDSSFALFKRFYQGHYVHEFNGALINKIPLLKMLQLREVAGAGFLVAPERDLRYAEAFAGIERVFKWPFNPLSKFKIGIYVVGSAANQFHNPVHFKVGLTTWDKVRNKWN